MGKRLRPFTPEECYRRAHVLELEVNRINPYSRPRGFIFKARTRAEFEAWRKAQPNPRRW